MRKNSRRCFPSDLPPYYLAFAISKDKQYRTNIINELFRNIQVLYESITLILMTI